MTSMSTDPNAYDVRPASDEDRKHREAVETQKREEATRQERFGRWDTLESDARERAEAASAATPAEDGGEVSAETPAPDAPPDRSELAIRPGLAPRST